MTMTQVDDSAGKPAHDKKHGDQKAKPNPMLPSSAETDQGIVRDERGQEQPRDKERAQLVSRTGEKI